MSKIVNKSACSFLIYSNKLILQKKAKLQKIFLLDFTIRTIKKHVFVFKLFPFGNTHKKTKSPREDR